MIQAVIFDMDGTLIDTEKYYRICWPQALAHFGYTMSEMQETLQIIKWVSLRKILKEHRH